MEKMIGLARIQPEVDEGTRKLLLLSYAYQVPVCSYCIKDIDTSRVRQTIAAQHWDGQGVSSFKAEIPFDTLFRFDILFQKKQGNVSQKLYDWLQANTHSITGNGVTKDVLSQVLMRSDLYAYAIPTYPVDSFAQLQSLTKLLKVAIVKPSYGRSALGVHRISLHNDTLLMDDLPLDEAGWNAYCNETAVMGRPILQPRLDFTDHKNRHITFRFCVARADGGAWKFLDSRTHVSDDGIASNLNHGGFMAKTEQVLECLVGVDAPKLLRHLETLSLDVAKLVQAQCAHTICAFGIDIGIDRGTMQPYIIEANTAPGAPFHHAWVDAEAYAQYFRYLLRRNEH